ncbi:MAG: leucine-rich repeat protein [Rikenellaceae bacterium]
MKKIILSIIALSALASCQKSEEQSTAVETLTAVTFTSEVSTRVSDTTWETGDEIGVFMYEVSSDVYDRYGTNALYYISSGAETTSAKFMSDDPLYFPQNYPMDFVAYYPYAEGTESGTAFTVGSTDQSSDEKLKAQDLMVARAASCYDGSSPTLSFERKMSKVVFNVDIKDTAKDLAVSDFTLSNVISGGTYTICNLSNALYTKVTAGTTTESISLFLNDSDEVEAIVPPHTATEAKISVSFGGNTYYGTFSETFESGMQYTYTLIVGQNYVELSGVTITDWTEVESGEMETAKINYYASEIDADNVPTNDTWVIMDETIDDYTGIKAALGAAKTAGRKISIILPNLTAIGDEAFSSCGALVAIDAPNVKTIGESAFYYTSITSFDFEGVESIGAYAFRYSTLVEVSNFSLKEIPDSAFGDTYLTTFDFSSVESMGEEAFSYCTFLAEITNFSITEIPASAFEGAAALTTFDFTSVESIGEAAFRNCSSLAEVTNFSLTEIPSYTFFNTAFTTFDFTGVASIGEYAFHSCTSLAEVTNFKIKDIPNNAFTSTALTTFDFTSVESIGEYAFYECSKLSVIELGECLQSIGSFAFVYTPITDLYLNWTGSAILSYVTRWFSSSPTVHIPAGTTADYEAKGWSALTLKEK